MLSGNLDAFPLPDVLAFVAKSGVTGRLEIIRDDVGGEISVDQGRFVAACLSEDEAPTTVDETLDVAVLLLDGSGGTFQFVSEDWVGGPLDLDGDAMLKAVEKRRKEWAAVIESLGSLEDPLVLVPELPVEQVAVSGDQWRLIALVDGQRSVHDLARDSASSVYAAARLLSEMSRMGMVTRGSGVVQRPTKSSKKRAVPDPEAEDLLRELGGEEEEEETPAAKAEPATVRPLRAPTREEQRLRLRR